MMRHLLASAGFEVFVWCDAPGAVYGMHKHECEQSHWVISGSLELTVETVGTFILESGDRDIMPAGTYHSARVIGDENVNYLVGEKKPKRRKR
jgi:quercetin dioxygenase-like cupin family protein